MPQNMRAYFGSGKLGCVRECSVLVDDPRNAATTELRMLLVEEYRIAIATRHIEAKLGQVVGQERYRVGTERNVTSLATLFGRAYR